MAAETLYRERRLSVNAIAEKLHISNSTPFTGSSGERLMGSPQKTEKIVR